MKARDLAAYSGPITQDFLTDAPDSEFELSADQIASFERDGFIKGIQVLTDDQLKVLRDEVAELMHPKYAKDSRFYEYSENESKDSLRVLFHALGAWRISAAFHDLLFDRAVTVPASQILGGQVRFWHDQLFVKPPGHGGIVAWHQDYSYWTRTSPVAHLTCWIGLDDSTIENGCLRYVPGSHRWDLLPKGLLADDMEAIFAKLDEDKRADFVPVPVEMKAGQASFHHSMLVHGSYENRSGRPRRGVVINMFRDGVVSETDEPLLEGVPVIPRGSKIDGPFFPMLRSISNSG